MVKLIKYTVRAENYGIWQGQAQNKFQAAQLAQIALGTPPRVSLTVSVGLMGHRDSVVSGQTFLFK